MRVCCGLTGHLELARRPDLYGSPVVVVNWDEHVIARSEEALPFGVVTGMALRQAEHLCPHATFLPPDIEAASQLRELLSSALYDLAPIVEVRVVGVAWLDVSDVPNPGESIRETRRRLRSAIGREPRLGLAPGPFSAKLAAAPARRGAPGATRPTRPSHPWYGRGHRPARARESAWRSGQACSASRARPRAGPAQPVVSSDVHERA